MRWLFVNCSVLGLLVMSTTPASAQSDALVRGQLVAEADGSALTQGTISLHSPATNQSIQTEVDANGRFVFPRVAPGVYELVGSSQGFADRHLSLTVAPREVRSVTVPLALPGIEVAVTVRGEPQPLPDTRSPSSTVLSSDRINALPISQHATLPDAIVTAAPGMIRGHDDFVHIRGEEVALNPLINGVAFWENAHAVFSAGFSPDVIDTASVMTGGFPAEYGNRFGGVVDIVTKSGFQLNGSGSATFNGGDAGRRTAQGEYGGRRERFGYYAFGSLFESDRFLSPPEPTAIHDHGVGAHALFQADANLGRAGMLRTTVIGDGVSLDIPKTAEDVELRPQAEATQRNRQQTAIVGWTRMASGFLLDGTVYERWSRARLWPAAGPLTAVASNRRDLFTLGGKFNVTHIQGTHTVKAGIEAVRLSPDEVLSYDYAGVRELSHLLGLPHIHITDNAIAFSGSTDGGEVSAYVQDSVQLHERITADVGLRVDRFDLLASATHASPRVNVAARLGGGNVIHASYDNFFIPPPIEGVLSSAAGLTARIREIGIALPPVQPTTEHQFEVGATVPAGPLRLAITGYTRASRNPVHTTVWPDARIYSYASFDRARAYGLETKAELTGLSRYGITGYVNYAAGRVYFYNPVTGGFVTEPEHLSETDRFLAPMDQTHTLTGGATYRHARSGLFLGTTIEYGSGTPREHAHADDGDADHVHAAGDADASARVPGHIIGNVSLGIDLFRRANNRPRLSFQIDAENVTNRSYLIAQESEFSPRQFSIPRLLGVTAKVRF
jgi:TonB dependent receptor/Carboxypeptidase regulatory-like domain